jgi:2-(1,2-epoxy-1,2-dihydrophenyl)acetyl-CoA isomerase
MGGIEMAYEYVTLEKEQGVAVITLNRPDRLNALGTRILNDLTAAIDEVSGDDEVRVVVFTGSGRGFCAGADLVEPSPFAAEERWLRVKPMARYGNLMLRLRNLEKPTIAAVNGIAAGGGFSLAMACDIRIASEDARFSSIFVRRALVVDMGLSYLLPRAVGTSKALELMYTGDIIDAQEAKEIGLVSKVVPHDDLPGVTKELATRIANGPPIAIELTKKAVYAAQETNNFASALSYESWAQEVCTASEDAQEGVRSFLEKREPVYKGK